MRANRPAEASVVAEPVRAEPSRSCPPLADHPQGTQPRPARGNEPPAIAVSACRLARGPRRLGPPVGGVGAGGVAGA